MKFGIVRPRERKVEIVDVRDSDDAKARAGLKRLETDHGTIFEPNMFGPVQLPGLGYICGQHAMFEHPQFYFAVGRVLMAGNVVLYAFAPRGATIDYVIAPEHWPGVWLGDEAAVEAAIRVGRIDRPRMAIQGDDVFWQWPAPKPDMELWAKKLADVLTQGPVKIDDTIILTIDAKK